MTSIPVDELQQAVEDSLLADVLLDATTLLRGFMPSEFDVKSSLFSGADSA